jgi:ABC-type dipeptide/oligopeptide/nickel transport system ATPase component
MQASEREMRDVRGRKIGLVLQNPLSSLNPAMTIHDQLFEAWRAHRRGYSARYSHPEMLDLLQLVSLPDAAPLLKRYPGQLSIGQAQRVLIAMAILHRPALLIADEPTSALDAITQSEVLRLFSRLSRQLRMGVLYISHDLPSVASICSRVAILRQGEVVEFDSAGKIFLNPRHPYTSALVQAIPRIPSFCGDSDRAPVTPCHEVSLAG